MKTKYALFYRWSLVDAMGKLHYGDWVRFDPHYSHETLADASESLCKHARSCQRSDGLQHKFEIREVTEGPTGAQRSIDG